MTWSPRLRAALWWWGIGYAAYYLCRTTFPVVRPVLIEELTASGMSVDSARASVGWVVSISLMAAAVGKLAAGVFIDRTAGRGTYFWGGAGVALSTVLFTLGGPGWWAFSWSGHRLAQTLGWPSLMRSVAWLVPRERTGWVVALLSLSWLIGDALSRATHGALLAAGVSWQWVMRLAALVLLSSMVWIRWRYPCEAKVGDGTGGVVAETGAVERMSVRDLLFPLLCQPAFWFAALASVSFTTLREGALEWGPTWLVEHGGMGKASAAASSAWFPLGGAVSALLAGRLGDGRGGGAKGWVLVGGALLAVGGVALLATVGRGSGAWGAVLLGLVGLAVTGPYALLLGAVAIDLGGGKAGATASSVIDGFGSLAAVSVGTGVASLVTRSGWSGAIGAMSVVSWVACAASLGFALATLGRRR